MEQLNNITLLVLTHRNSNTIFRTIDSFKSMVDKDIPIIIGYDNHNDNIYKQILETYCKNYNYSLVVTDNSNLSQNLINSIENINTKYVFILEHDWEFISNINLSSLITLMDNYNNINYIRFNKRKTILFEPFDSPLEEINIDGINLLKVWSYSGNPHIVRTSFLKDIVVKVIEISKWKNHPKRGMEASMTELIKLKAKKFGLGTSHNMFGTYIYGKMGDNAVVTHIGG